MTLVLLFNAQATTGSSYLLSLGHLTATARYDGIGWTRIKIEEAETAIGPWSQLVSADIDLGPDPANPEPMDITVVGARLPAGYYRVTFRDASGRVESLAPIWRGIPWAPTVQDVAELSPGYTRSVIDGDGEQAGAPRLRFDEQTNPTAAQVRALISAAVKEVSGRAGVPVARLDQFADLARITASYHAAAAIEAERHPTFSDDGDGAYQWKRASYVANLNELIAQARRVRPAVY